MGKVVLIVTLIGATAACAVAGVVVQRYVKKSRRWGKAMSILKEFEENCATPTWKLKQVADAMTVEMHAGLASEGGSKLKMLLTFVDNLPTGLVLHCIALHCVSFDPNHLDLFFFFSFN